MARPVALRMLSPAHAEILILDETGLDAAGVAGRLSLDVAAVGPALEVARTKLAAIEARDGVDEPVKGEQS